MTGRRFSEDTLAGADPTKLSKDDAREVGSEHAAHDAASKPDQQHIDQSRRARPDGKRELKEIDAPEVLGYAYPTWKKWSILGVIFIVQCSMNFNASIYANGVGFLQDKFDISAQAARVGQMIFLVSYAFGCELWAPWSEELGRWPTLQLSLLFVNSNSRWHCW
jgi:hypothetical protein